MRKKGILARDATSRLGNVRNVNKSNSWYSQGGSA